MLRFIHGADLHLDSAFGGLPARQAAQRRQESREMLFRLAEHVNRQEIHLVLLAGDLFDSAGVFQETGEQLSEALGQMRAVVCIAPGNHDWYGPGSPWLTVEWPGNVHVFTSPRLSAVEVPEWNLTVHGAAFQGPEQTESLLAGFRAPPDGRVHIGLLHGELEPAEARYNPLSREEAAASGLHYLALGHIHKRTEPLRLGRTLCAWPGCPEGRGFDELGEKGFYQGTLDESGQIELSFLPFAKRRYEVLEVDVTRQSLRSAVEAALPEDTERDLYRLRLVGEAGAEGTDLASLREALVERFYALEIQDHTRLAQDLWARAGENSLRGLFLQKLRTRLEHASGEEERELVTRAARFGLAALEHRDLG